MKRLAAFTAGSFVALGLAGIATPAVSHAAPLTPRAGGTITISASAHYTPHKLVVTPGAKVMVTNNDSVKHSVTSFTSAWKSKTLKPGVTKSFAAPSAPGKYPYYCKFHSMEAILKVKK